MRKSINLEMIEIPEGEFLIGDSNQPIYLKSYKITKYTITNAQFKAFRDSLNPWQRTTIAIPKHWQNAKIPVGKEEHPVVYVNWYEANYFAQWFELRLPTEAEWEKASRGGLYLDGRESQKIKNPNPKRIYPWGDDFDTDKCNSSESGNEDTTAVGTYQDGKSPYGVIDLSGNVWEWCSTLYKTRNEDLSAYGSRVLRGGAWDVDSPKVRCTYRYRHNIEYRLSSIGFRCVEDM